MTVFLKFPHTPHLAWLGVDRPRGDKVLSKPEQDAFLSGEVVIEEKVDGASIGFSVEKAGRLRVQNRGGYIGPGAHPQFGPLWGWITEREAALAEALGTKLMLFGEWCFAVHSVCYDCLPDWFLGFDVYAKAEGRFWPVERRNELLAWFDLAAVPKLGQGRYTYEYLLDLLKHPSSVGTGPREGLYLRRETNGWLEKRAKLVRAEFVQAIGEHWSKRELKKNRLALPSKPREAGGRCWENPTEVDDSG